MNHYKLQEAAIDIICQKDETILRLQGQLESQEQVIADLEHRLGKLNEVILAQRKEMEMLSATIDSRDERIDELALLMQNTKQSAEEEVTVVHDENRAGVLELERKIEALMEANSGLEANLKALKSQRFVRQFSYPRREDAEVQLSQRLLMIDFGKPSDFSIKRSQQALLSNLELAKSENGMKEEANPCFTTCIRTIEFPSQFNEEQGEAIPEPQKRRCFDEGVFCFAAGIGLGSLSSYVIIKLAQLKFT